MLRVALCHLHRLCLWRHTHMLRRHCPFRVPWEVRCSLIKFYSLFLAQTHSFCQLAWNFCRRRLDVDTALGLMIDQLYPPWQASLTSPVQSQQSCAGLSVTYSFSVKLFAWKLLCTSTAAFRGALFHISSCTIQHQPSKKSFVIWHHIAASVDLYNKQQQCKHKCAHKKYSTW